VTRYFQRDASSEIRIYPRVAHRTLGVLSCRFTRFCSQDQFITRRCIRESITAAAAAAVAAAEGGGLAETAFSADSKYLIPSSRDLRREPFFPSAVYRGKTPRARVTRAAFCRGQIAGRLPASSASASVSAADVGTYLFAARWLSSTLPRQSVINFRQRSQQISSDGQ